MFECEYCKIVCLTISTVSLPKWKRSGLCEAAQLSAPTTIHSASRWMFHWNVIPFFKSSTNVCGGVLFWLFGIKDELVCYVCVCMDVIATMVLLSSVVFSFFLLFIWMIFHLFFLLLSHDYQCMSHFTEISTAAKVIEWFEVKSSNSTANEEKTMR